MPSEAKILEIISKDKPVLVDFYAKWVNPCKMMSSIVKEAKGSIKEQITVLELDIEKYPQVADKYQVVGLPSLLLFKKGELLWRNSGLVPCEYLIKELESHLEKV
jgi:thioredoxin 1